MAKKQQSEKYAIFHLEGGLGKHIAATAVAKCIKNNYPDRELIIVCAYPEIFLNLPFIDRVYRIGNTPYFYKDYIYGKDSLIFRHEPYFTSEHIHKELPLIENWCKLYNLEFSGEYPELVFNVRQQQFGFKRWNRERPIAVIQTNGGPLNEQPYLYSWTRDIPSPTAHEIVSQLSQEYHVIQICRSIEQAIPGAEAIFEPMSNMELLSLLLFSQKRILIDSSIQHAAAALNLKSTVLWIGTSPKVFGYDLHENMVAALPSNVKLPDSYLFDYNFHGANHECPLLDLNIFDTAEILNSL
jgi:hypothetical protein